jgi:hypothetical protein
MQFPVVPRTRWYTGPPRAFAGNVRKRGLDLFLGSVENRRMPPPLAQLTLRFPLIVYPDS